MPSRSETCMTSRLAISGDALARAADMLAAGRLVAFPTETVYGLGGDACNTDAVAAIFAAKDRPSFNWSKLELLRVRHEGHVRLPTGKDVKEKDVLIYLGGVLSADGRVSSELARRLGAAAADFT